MLKNCFYTRLEKNPGFLEKKPTLKKSATPGKVDP